jgi:hypothetical protein
VSARDDLEQAADAARQQVEEARAALRRIRSDAGGGPAGSIREAEAQLASLRDAIEKDVRTLRDRASSVSITTPGPARTAAITAGAGLVAIAGIAAFGSIGLRRASRRRDIERQARALAAALAHRTSEVGQGPRRGRSGLLVVAAGAALAAVAVARHRRRPVDPDDLWLPERGTQRS